MSRAPIEIHRYELRPRRAIGHLAGPRAGFLVRLDGLGVADVHPWPELGDAPLEAHLEALRAGHASPLVARALELARLDLDARSRRRSLFDGVRAPPSHRLTSFAETTESVATEAVVEAFPAVKLKIGVAPAAEALWLRDLDARLGAASVRLRLDANERFERAAFESWVESLGESLRDRIEFFEDPFPFEASAWAESARRLRARFALDRRLVENLAQAPGPLDAETIADEPTIWVLKPGAEAVDVALTKAHAGLKRLMFTHTLGHPVGQSAAAVVAAHVAAMHPLLVEVGGLKAANVFERTVPLGPFLDELESPGPDFRAPRGTGFGFDEALAALDWEALNP